MLRWRLACAFGATAIAFSLSGLCGCVGSGASSSGSSNSANAGNGAAASGQRRSDLKRSHSLDSLPTATIAYGDKQIRVWIANEDDTRAEGLMHVPADELADDQGMLFVFADEAQRGFWMRNTITPLDIAFARMNGTIVKIHQMPALTLETFPSVEPAMFALEMKAGSFGKLGIADGGVLVIPDSVATSGK